MYRIEPIGKTVKTSDRKQTLKYAMPKKKKENNKDNSFEMLLRKTLATNESLRK